MDPLSTLKQMQQLVATFANSIPSTLPGNPRGKMQGKPPMAYQSGGANGKFGRLAEQLLCIRHSQEVGMINDKSYFPEELEPREGDEATLSGLT